MLSLCIIIIIDIECDCLSDDCEPYTGRCSCSNTTDPSCCSYSDVYNATLHRCVPCDCHPMGSIGVCDRNAMCVCKAGVEGKRCGRCLPGYHSLTEGGCRRCSCNRGGSTGLDICDVDTGQCECLDDVVGLTCDTCPDGTLGPIEDATTPCISCYCNGYSMQCTPRSNWYQALIVDEFRNESHVSNWSSNGAIEYM